MSTVLDLPTRPEPGVTYRVEGTLTRAEWAALERLRRSEFFLVRNDGRETGERWNCGRCGAKHQYFTCMCVERPFRGLDHALYTYVQVNHDEYLHRQLSPYIPDLSATNPMFARSLRPKDKGAEFYAIALGLAEPITVAKARDLCQAISLRAGRPFMV